MRSRQAIEKASSFGLSLDGAVMASDAFFPFPDCVEIANDAGIKAVSTTRGVDQGQRFDRLL
jgi:AICAR transformylase/IMP cyclohydrolase PurH